MNQYVTQLLISDTCKETIDNAVSCDSPEKIPAIKALRAELSMPLKESKGVIEQYINHLSNPNIPSPFETVNTCTLSITNLAKLVISLRSDLNKTLLSCSDAPIHNGPSWDYHEKEIDSIRDKFSSELKAKQLELLNSKDYIELLETKLSLMRKTINALYELCIQADIL